MRMLFTAEFPPEPFNSLCRSGSAGKLLGAILEELKPEAAYFSEQNGMRGAVLIVDVNGAKDITRVCEPFFLKLNAECRLRVLMTAQELAGADLEGLGKKWS